MNDSTPITAEQVVALVKDVGQTIVSALDYPNRKLEAIAEQQRESHHLVVGSRTLGEALTQQG